MSAKNSEKDHGSGHLTTCLTTTRLTLVPFDGAVDEHTDLQLAILLAPETIATMGDFGIRTRKDMLGLLNSTAIKPRIFPSLTAPEVAIFIVHLEPQYAHEYANHPFPGSGNSGPMIGAITLADRSSQLPPDMGWGFLPQYHNKGFATEAGKASLDFWTSSPDSGGAGIEEIMAWPKESHVGSVRTAQKIGFIKNGYIECLEEPGVKNVVYTLPGMKAFEEGTRISILGEGQ